MLALLKKFNQMGRYVAVLMLLFMVNTVNLYAIGDTLTCGGINWSVLHGLNDRGDTQDNWSSVAYSYNGLKSSSTYWDSDGAKWEAGTGIVFCDEHGNTISDPSTVEDLGSNWYYMKSEKGDIVQMSWGQNHGFVLASCMTDNHPPTANDFTYGTAIGNSAKTFDWFSLSSAEDSDGDTLTASVKTQGGKGSAVIDGNNTTYTPNEDQTGSDSFELTISDGTDSIDITVTVNGINSFTTSITIDNTIVTDEDTNKTISFSANDINDGDITNQLVVEENATQGSVILAHPNLTYSPNPNFYGEDSFSVSVTNSNGKKIEATIDVTVNAVNDAPVITSKPVTTVIVDNNYSYTLTVNDDDGDKLTLNTVNKPNWLNLTTKEVEVLAADHSFNSPAGVAVESRGVVYVADYVNKEVKKIDLNGTVTLLAEDHTFTTPSGVALDSSGVVYVTEYYTNKIKKIDLNGTVTVLDQNHACFQPMGIAVDGHNNIYVADYGNSKIKKIAPDGTVTIVAENESFNYPADVAVDSNGIVYVADKDNNQIKSVATDGTVTILASTHTFSGPFAIDVDSTGAVYVADTDNKKIKKIATDGTVTVLAEDETFEKPMGIAVDSNGTVYVSDSDANKVIKIYKNLIVEFSGVPTDSDRGKHDVNLTLSDGTVTVKHDFQITVVVTDINFTIDEDSVKTFTVNDFNLNEANIIMTALPTKGALKLSGSDVTLNQVIPTSDIVNLSFTPEENGNGTPYASFTFVTNDGEQNSTFEYTVTINVTPINDVPVITSTPITEVLEESSYTYLLEATDADGDSLEWNAVTLPSWLNLQSQSGDPVTTLAGDGNFYAIQGMAVDQNGVVYVADFDYKVKKVDTNGTVTTLAPNEKFTLPQDVAVDSSGAVYVVDGNSIKKIATDGTVTILAPDGTLSYPRGIDVDSSGVVYVLLPYEIKKIELDGTISSYLVDSTRTGFTGIDIDSNGTVFVATYDNKVKRVEADGTLTVLAPDETFGGLTDIAVDSNGVIYVVDWTNKQIKKIDLDDTVTALVPELFVDPGAIAVDQNGLVYAVEKEGTDQIKTISLTPTQLIGTPTDADVGVHNVKLTVSDGTVTVEHNFQITVTKLSNDLENEATTIQIDDNLDVDLGESDGTQTATIHIGDETLTIELSENGTIEGTVAFTDAQGNPATSTFKVNMPPSSTSVDADGNIEITVASGTDTTTKITMGIDGSVKYEVQRPEGTTIVTSAIPGLSVEVDAQGNVQMSSTFEKNGLTYRVVVVTDVEGQTETTLFQVDILGEEIESHILKEGESFAVGSAINLMEINDIFYIEVIAPLGDQALEIE